MKCEKFTGSIEQVEKYNIKFTTALPIKKRWYRYDPASDTISFLNEGYWIITSNDNQQMWFVTDQGYQAFKTSHNQQQKDEHDQISNTKCNTTN